MSAWWRRLFSTEPQAESVPAPCPEDWPCGYSVSMRADSVILMRRGTGPDLDFGDSIRGRSLTFDETIEAARRFAWRATHEQIARNEMALAAEARARQLGAPLHPDQSAQPSLVSRPEHFGLGVEP